MMVAKSGRRRSLAETVLPMKENGEFDSESIFAGLGITIWDGTFERAIALASTRLKGKYHTELLSCYLRDPELRSNLTEKDWDLLAYFVEGQIKNKPGKRGKGAPFGWVDRKLSPEQVAAFFVQTEMKNRRESGENAYGVRGDIIRKWSEKHGANLDTVTRIINKARVKE